MASSTTNYALQKPAVNSATDQDLWGGELNDDLDDIDALLRAGICIDTSAQSVSFTAVATISSKIMYLCTATAGAITATLPTAASAGDGAVVYFKKMNSNANNITIARASSDTIDGATSKIISTQYNVIALVSDGVSAWSVLQIAPSVFTGDSGSGGTTGIVPAPGAGDSANDYFLAADATFKNPDKLSTATGTAPSYSARAWVRFTGTTGAIISSGNVTSVTRNGTGDYTVTFTTALPDANYIPEISARPSSLSTFSVQATPFSTAGSPRVAVPGTTTTFRFALGVQGSSNATDGDIVCVTIFR